MCSLRVASQIEMANPGELASICSPLVVLDGLPIILQIVVLNDLLIILQRSRANDPNARTEKKCLHFQHSCLALQWSQPLFKIASSL